MNKGLTLKKLIENFFELSKMKENHVTCFSGKHAHIHRYGHAHPSLPNVF